MYHFKVISLPSFDSKGASDGVWLYSITLSTEVILFSKSTDVRMPNCSIPVKDMAEEIARPASLLVTTLNKTTLLQTVFKTESKISELYLLPFNAVQM